MCSDGNRYRQLESLSRYRATIQMAQLSYGPRMNAKVQLDLFHLAYLYANGKVQRADD